VTHIDGLVLARSAFHHSMNYRSAAIYGVCEQVKEEAKAAALQHFMQHIARGREKDARPPDRNELAATLVLRLKIDEAAAKIREGGPKDDEADLSLPVWAGVVPLRQQRLSPPPRPRVPARPPPFLVREVKLINSFHPSNGGGAGSAVQKGSRWGLSLCC